MRDPRLILIIAAGPVGMVLGAAVWLAVGGDTAATRRLADLEISLGTAPAPEMVRRGPSGLEAAFLSPRPLFLPDAVSSAVSTHPSVRSSRTQVAQLTLSGR